MQRGARQRRCERKRPLGSSRRRGPVTSRSTTRSRVSVPVLSNTTVSMPAKAPRKPAGAAPAPAPGQGAGRGQHRNRGRERERAGTGHDQHRDRHRDGLVGLICHHHQPDSAAASSTSSRKARRCGRPAAPAAACRSRRAPSAGRSARTGCRARGARSASRRRSREVEAARHQRFAAPARDGVRLAVSSASSTVAPSLSSRPSPGRPARPAPARRRRPAASLSDTGSKPPSSRWRSQRSGRRLISASSAPAVRSRALSSR